MAAKRTKPARHARSLMLASSALASAVLASGANAQADPGVTASAAGAQPTPASAQRLNTTGRTIDLVVPLRERVPLGQVAIRITTDDRVSVSKADLTAALSRFTTEAFRARIDAIASGDGFIPVDALASNGLMLTFDPGSLDLTARLDSSAKPERGIDFGYGGNDNPILPDESAPFAAYLSYQGSWDWVHGGQRSGLRKPRVNFDFNGRMFNRIAFENELTYDGEFKPAFSRFASRLIYDRPNSLLRFSAGDLVPVTLAFQDQVDVGGIGISKLLNEFRPDRLFSATAGRRITLREPARVTLIVNGAPARTLNLDAGSFSLEDLPLTGGANNVELLIEDEAGGRRIVSFDFFQDIALLAKGVDEFDLKAGVRSDFEDGHRDYFRNRPLLTGFYRRGLTDQLTASINTQITRGRAQFGTEASLGTSIGLFTIDGSVSRIDGFGMGHAMRLQYRYSTPLQQLAGARRFDVLVEERSRDFGGVETRIPNNPFRLLASARYSQPFTDKLSGGLGVDYRIGRGSQPNRYSIRANASYRFANGIAVNGSVGFDKPDGFNFGATLFWRLGRKSLVTARYDSRFDDGSVAFFHTPTRLLDTVAWGVEATRGGDNYGVNGTAVWRTNRGDLEIAERASLVGSGEHEQTTSLRARGTFAFAGGKFAMGRYLSDSFAIVSAHRSLQGANVYIGNRIAENAEARTGALGPALVSLSSYSQRNLFYDVPDAPAGYDFGTGNLELYPWLHAGLTRTVGSEFNVTIFGNLLDDRGEPLGLIAGEARRVGDAKSPQVPVFTNRQGRLGAAGLAPGNWRIEAGDFIYDFVVTEQQGSFVDLQSLRPTGRRENGQ